MSLGNCSVGNERMVSPSQSNKEDPRFSIFASQYVFRLGCFSAQSNVEMLGQAIEANRHVVSAHSKL